MIFQIENICQRFCSGWPEVVWSD